MSFVLHPFTRSCSRGVRADRENVYELRVINSAQGEFQMNRKTMVIAIGFLLAFCLGIHFYAEWNMAQFDASLPKPPDPKQAAHAESQEAEPHAGHDQGPEEHFLLDEATHADEALRDIFASPTAWEHAEAKQLWAQLGKTPEEVLSQEALDFWREVGVTPPPPGYSYAELDDGTFNLQKENTPIVSVSILDPPEFDAQWLPDDAFHYYLSLLAIVEGEADHVLGVTSEERNIAQQTLDEFQSEWTLRTSFGFSASGVYDPDRFDLDTYNADTDRKIAELEAQLRNQLGIYKSEQERHTADWELIGEIVADIRTGGL